jgi:RND superfamily putative drug exporter
LETEPLDDLLGEEIDQTDLSAAARARAPIARSGRERNPLEPERPPARMLALRRPRLVIGIWLALALVLGVIGLFAKQVLHAEDLVIGGTPSARALAADERAFGKNSPLTVMLEGPPLALDAAGPALVRRLNAIDGVSAASPWSAGAPDLLRQQPGRALLILSVDRGVVDTGKHTLPKIDAALAGLPPGITHRVAGQPRFSTELVNLVFSGALKAELLAFPFLLLILLLIFRAPIAAATPLIQGLAVIGVTTGLVTLLGLLTPVNILAQASGSIIGLALGVDYSLLFVSRFRDELAAGRSTDHAVTESLRTAGRTVAFAGGILILAGLLVIAISFGWASMTTGSIGVVTAGLVSVIAALTLLPACLKLIGPRIDHWAIGSTGRPPLVAGLVNRITARPVLATVLALVPLLALCAAAFGLRTGGPDLKMFNRDNPMRVDMEAVADRFGGGVMAPYTVIASSADLPLTSPSDVRALSSFQQKVAQDPAVAYVVGLGNNRVRRFSDATEQAPGNLARLDVGLGAASTGATRARRGLRTASSGASQLAAANAAALAGARTLADGLAQAQAGSGDLDSGLGRAAGGADRIDGALDELRAGTRELRLGTRSARNSARGFVNGVNLLGNLVDQTGSAIAAIGGSGAATSAIDQAIGALDSLPAADQSDPSVQNARSALTAARSSAGSAVSGVSYAQSRNDKVRAAIALARQWADRAREGANQLDAGAGRLNSGVGRIAAGSDRLSSGLNQLSAGSGRLRNGLTPLAGGSRQLAGGLGSIAGGSSALAGSLDRGSRQSRRLARGLNSGHRRIARLRAAADRQGAVRIKDVGRSPYLTMALLSAAPRDQKRNLGLVLNEPRGGTATRTYVITEQQPTSKSLAAFNDRLERDTGPLARRLGASVAVGGPGRTFLDYDNFTRHRIWILLSAMSLMSFLFLLVVFRSVLLAVKAVILNLITVGAAMGLVALLYQGRNPLLGGPGWMEATSFFVVYSTTFALSMDYEIFMINRMRESYLQSGSNERAISDGVVRTAGIVTGSALVMCVLFVAMALTSDLVSSAQLGLGLAFAIAIDATLVRLILLPATMRLFGEANWWLPPWLDRALPDVALH